MARRWQGILAEYREYLPLTDQTPMLTLYEGNTPLVRAEKLSEQFQLDIYLKYEGLNPTGSFKDRGMVMAVAKAVEEGSQSIICASTGNTSASAAAYATRAGLRCVVVIPQGKVALGKLAQAIMYGAEIIAIEGNFDEALHIVRRISETEPITLVNSVNPYRIDGQQSAAFEVCEALEKAPDVLAIPVGNAGNITAYWKGFKRFYELGKVNNLPRMWGFEAAGSAAIVRGQPIANPETIATAIRIGNPASWNLAVQAVQESDGLFDEVTDEEILEAYHLVARHEGVFCEPASAASLAGVIKKRRQGQLEEGATVVCVLTGNGLKDPDTAMSKAEAQVIQVPSDEDAVRRAIAGTCS